MPYVPNAWTPPTPGPVYFNPGLKNAVQSSQNREVLRERTGVARDRNALDRERFDYTKDQNALSRQAMEGAASDQQKEADNLRVAGIISSYRPQTLEELESIAGPVNEFWKKGYGVDIEGTQRFADKMSGTEKAEPKEWKPTTKDEAFEYKKAGQKPEKPKDYTQQQQIDDTRGYYSEAAKAMLDPDRFIKPGYEEQYNALLKDMADDMQRINKGKKPKWLTGEKIKTPTAVKMPTGGKLSKAMASEILTEAKGDKAEARRIAKERGYIF